MKKTKSKLVSLIMTSYITGSGAEDDPVHARIALHTLSGEVVLDIEANATALQYEALELLFSC